MYAGSGPLSSAFFACHLVLCLIVRTVYQRNIKSQLLATQIAMIITDRMRNVLIQNLSTGEIFMVVRL